MDLDGEIKFRCGGKNYNGKFSITEEKTNQTKSGLEIPSELFQLFQAGIKHFTNNTNSNSNQEENKEEKEEKEVSESIEPPKENMRDIFAKGLMQLILNQMQSNMPNQLSEDSSK